MSIWGAPPQPYSLDWSPQRSLLERATFILHMHIWTCFHTQCTYLFQAAVYKGSCLFAFIKNKFLFYQPQSHRTQPWKQLAIKLDTDRPRDAPPMLNGHRKEMLCKLAHQLYDDFLMKFTWLVILQVTHCVSFFITGRSCAPSSHKTCKHGNPLWHKLFVICRALRILCSEQGGTHPNFPHFLC